MKENRIDFTLCLTSLMLLGWNVQIPTVMWQILVKSLPRGVDYRLQEKLLQQEIVNKSITELKKNI